ncbi:cytotoxic T-lymphocyte protein 4-like [Heptranchias perlo]|uniref:cytotoxic T-lymphocyte protein 4-like n=1 Tax=Heptranchias perlo TaxID=212740 RepID=UPI0035593949
MKSLDRLAISLICLLMAVKTPAEAMKVTQPKFILAEGRNVTLECKYNITGDGHAEEIRISIYKGKEDDNNEVCAASFNSSTKLFKRTTALHCQGRPREDSVSITFSGLNTSHSDWYICKVEKMHPPPYTEASGNGTWIFIKPDEAETKPCREFTQATLIVLVLVVIFSSYSIFITCLHWVLTKNQEEQNNEYVNMEPPKHSSGRKRGNHIGYRT